MRNQSWDSYERAAEKGPMAIAVKIIVALFILGALTSIVGYGLGWFSEAAKVAQKEFGPSALLRKYEWFKDAAAVLEKKQADIRVYGDRISQLKEDYKGKTRNEWTREDREQINVWMSEVSGIKASYNSLAAEYNAQMAKFNWRFTNAGELPQGAETPLPREFKPYTIN